MTVFSLHGSKIQTDLNGEITEIQETMLEAITPIGTNSLDVAYLGDLQNPLAISLSDYNLKFDNVHINDADLPTQIEYFDLVSAEGGDVRVINFVFKTTGGIEERMFSVGQTALPNFASPSEASLFFAQHEPIKIVSQDDWTIQFTQIEDAKASGVFVDLEHLSMDASANADRFDFRDIETAAENETWDIEFANAAQLQDAVAATLNVAEDIVETETTWTSEPDLPVESPSSVELDAG